MYTPSILVTLTKSNYKYVLGLLGVLGGLGCNRLIKDKTIFTLLCSTETKVMTELIKKNTIAENVR